MPNTYCLLVGIDKYSNPSHNLKGCVNDLNSIENYLKLSIDESKLKIEKLINNQATKTNIINGFQHFQNAKERDTCIFYYSGHGSFWDAPEIFHKYYPSKQFESIVCHDSRDIGNIDLMNIELAYLIWEATYQKEIQFIAITDCCHSGDIVKDIEDETFAERKLEKGSRDFDFKDLYLDKFISKSEILSHDFQIKRGQYIHLAACRGDQKAIEIEFEKEKRGVFTYFLIESLRTHSGEISYENLIRKINVKVQSKVSNQAPQLSKIQDSDEQKKFLTSTIDTGNILCEVRYYKGRGWVATRGTLNSPLDEFTKNEATVRIIVQDLDIALDQVHSTYSSLQIDDRHDLTKSEVYDGYLLCNKFDNLKVDITQVPKDLIKNLLSEYHEKENVLSFSFSNENIPTEIELHYKEPNGYFILDKKNKASKIRKNTTFPTHEIEKLFTAFERLSNWKYLLNLNGNNNSIITKNLSIDFYRLHPSDNNNLTQFEKRIEFVNTIELVHESLNNKDYPPEFKLKFTNIGTKHLWISLIYLCDDYMITNRLLAKQMLKPNEYVLASEMNRAGDLIHNIRIKLSDQLYDDGMRETKEYIKIIVSAEEFDTNYFNQSGIYSNKKYKEIEDRYDEVNDVEWGSKTVCLLIKRHNI